MRRGDLSARNILGWGQVRYSGQVAGTV